jgi:DNA-binding CsgD family transcriptional regulator
MKRENFRRRALRPFNPNPDCSLGPLTKMERKVVELIVQAHNNESIGRQLSISPETVKRHVSTILLKLECTSRTEVAVKVLNRQFEDKFRQLVSKTRRARTFQSQETPSDHSPQKVSENAIKLIPVPRL